MYEEEEDEDEEQLPTRGRQQIIETVIITIIAICRAVRLRAFPCCRNTVGTKQQIHTCIFACGPSDCLTNDSEVVLVQT